MSEKITKDEPTTCRIRLKAYNPEALRITASILVGELNRLDKLYKLVTKINGPVRLPVRKRYYSLLRSPHIDKNSQEQFEVRRHKWFFDLVLPRKNYINLLARVTFPAGIEISIIFPNT
jgi:small subunit ribosomal protein S10